MTVTVRYWVSRPPQDAPLAGKATRRDRLARGKEVVESEIRTIAANATRGLSDPLAKGRELELSPPQKGRPLNFLSRPYAEFDGEARPGLPFERSYASAAPGG